MNNKICIILYNPTNRNVKGAGFFGISMDVYEEGGGFIFGIRNNNIDIIGKYSRCG
jgi:hypothetical protein